jgi:hypothetical protein
MKRLEVQIGNGLGFKVSEWLCESRSQGSLKVTFVSEAATQDWPRPSDVFEPTKQFREAQRHQNLVFLKRDRLNSVTKEIQVIVRL